MATVILVRHGRTDANANGVLAGRQKGVHLDDLGKEQAARAGERLAGTRLARIVTSPLERTRETAAAIARAQAEPPRPVSERRLLECDYGEWQGRPIKELARHKLWRTVQQQPSAATFPGGESMRSVAARAVDAVRRHDAEVTAEHGDAAVWVAVSHGDVIKAIVGDALGQPLDLFQRIVVDPGSVTVVRYAADRPFVLATNTHVGDVADWAPTRTSGRARRGRSDAVVGGGAGPTPSGRRS
jgi:probable phosphomutase (TIGR03848 family)